MTFGENTRELRRTAIKFEENGYYTRAPKGTQEYFDFWEREKDRCLNGYKVGNLEITGYHYFYLNFGRIKKVVNQGQSKVMAFPDFWDGDYNYFWALHIARYGMSEEEYNNLHLGIDIPYLDGGRHLVVLKGRRKGYAQPNSQLIETPTGKTPMGDLSVGNEVLGSNGKPTKITEIHPQGKKEVFEVELRDGRTAKCSKNHLWSVVDYRGNKRVVTTEYMINNTKLIHNKGKSNQYYHWYIENPEPIEYSKKQLPLNPYLVGAYLGDGCGNKGTVKITSTEEKLINNIQLPKNHWFKNKKDSIDYVIRSEISKPNEVIRKLKELNIYCKTENKHIPDIYLNGSVNQRMELLRGLMDTDGSCTQNGAIRFGTSSKKLKDDFIRLLSSLGIRYYLSPTVKPGDTFAKLDHYVINITTDKDVFKLERKRKRINKNRDYNFNKIPIVNIKSLGYKEDQTCITVDAKDSLYLSEDFVTTHNTYKAGSMMVRNFTLKRDSTTYAMASSKDYLIDDGLLDKGAWPTLAHINNTTPFRQPLLVDKKEKKKSGYKEKIGGNYVEKGTKNEIIGISLKDNPEKARGKGGELGFFEEAGKFPGLLKAWEVCKPSYEQGKYTTGLMIAYGTGGTEDGDYEALEQLFYDPNTYDVLPIKNIWDDGASATTGLFIPGSQNLDGFMDEYGNSDEEAAEEFLNEKRKAKKQGNDKRAAEQYIAEFPLNPREATLRVDTNIFPSDALEKQLGDVIASQRHHALSVGILTRDTKGKVKFQPDNDKQPLFKFPTPRDIDTTGAIVIKESPQTNDQGKVPKNLYFICHDPYAYDGQPDGGSLGASYVIKRANNFSHTYMGCPVASYVGRPPTQDEYNENLFKLAEYYNAKIAFENDRGNVIPYAKSNRLLSYLIEKPEIMENKSSNRRTTNRPYGISMNNSQLKNQGEIYIRDWLNEKVSKDAQGNIQRVYNRILDPALLEELMKYNSDGNFDRVSALMIGMFFMKELEHQRASVKHKENTDDFFNRQLFT